MTSTSSTKAGTEPHSQRERLGFTGRDLRLLARRTLFRLLAATPLPELATRPSRGANLILCLHNVVHEHGPLGVNRGLDLTTSELDTAISFLRTRGYRPLHLQDLVRAHENGHKSDEGRFALTFDDGYAGNLHVAYPLLRERGVPFTVYVTTGYMDREVRVWWYELERLLASSNAVAYSDDSRRYSYPLATRRQKIRAYRAIRQRLLAAPPSLADRILEQLFAGRIRHLSELGQEDVLSAEQVRVMSRDPLVTIGAHTTSHPVLRQLDEDTCSQEIAACRGRLMSVTDASIDHFAYPFGNRAACGPREARLAREAGYATAATTAARYLAPADSIVALPRIMLTAELDVVTQLRVLMTGWFGRKQ